MTSVTLAVVCALAARSHHQSSDEEDVFRVPSGIACLMLGFAVFFCLVPFFPGASGHLAPGRFFWYFVPFWGGAFFFALYLFRYRVIVRGGTLTTGAFRRRVISFADVIDWDLPSESKSPELWVYLNSGKKVKFSGMLGDFDDLVGLVNSHMAGLPEPQHDCQAKLNDRAARIRGLRRPN